MMQVVYGILILICSVVICILEYKHIKKVKSNKDQHLFLLMMIVLTIFVFNQVTELYEFNLVDGLIWIFKPIADPMNRFLNYYTKF